MIKIGFDAKRVFFNHTGLGNYSRTLIEGLVAQYFEDNFHLFTPSIKSDYLKWFNDIKDTRDSFELITPKGFFYNYFPALWRGFKISRLLGDLDIFHGLSHELPRGIEKSGVKSIVTIHDLIYLRYPEFFSWIDRIIYNSKFRHSCKVADRIVAISEQTKSDIVEFFNVDPERITVVYQSCNPIFYDGKECGKTLDLPEEYLLFVGSFNERKNILTSIRAFSQCSKKYSDLKLVLVGSGHQEESVNDLIRTLSLEKRVIHLKGLTNIEIKELYERAKIFLFPSFFEGFGIPIIESLFSKTPVITSVGSCFREAGGEGCLYIDPHSSSDLSKAIEQLLSDEHLYKDLVEKGYEHVEQFHFEKCACHMHDVYEEVLNK